MDKKTNPISDIFRDQEIPQLTAVYLIEETHNHKYTRLFHSHDYELELYYVHSGSGYYMVENQLYAVKEGDMIICNAKVLHGDAPAFNNNMRSYCCALTNVKMKQLADNCFIDHSTYPIVSCGSFSEKLGHMMEMLFMLSLDFEQLYDVCSSMSISILLLVNQLLQSRSRHHILTSARKSDAIVDKIKNYLDTHYTKPLTLEMISRDLGMTPNYVSHAFKTEMDISPIHYLHYRRFGEAQSLLMNTELTIGEISDLLGFSNPAHFSAMFKKHVGLSPVQYKRSINEMNNKSL